MRLIRRLMIAVVLLLVLVLGLLFTLQNSVPVPIDLLVVQLTERPLAVWVLTAFALGGFLGVLVSSVALIRLQSSRARLRRRLERLEKSTAPASTMPVVQ
ncbi:MAG: LapA family protein [Spongiibacteraceae bacterium]|jgi:putative membrane protein|nr:LapA family protein [Spongiibacteraceae bacterium]